MSLFCACSRMGRCTPLPIHRIALLNRICGINTRLFRLCSRQQPGSADHSHLITSSHREREDTTFIASVPLPHTRQRCRLSSTKASSDTPSPSDKEVVYMAPLKGAVRAIKVFSLTTAVSAFFGGPVLVWLGNPSVPLVGRVLMSSVVMLVGLGTTALLHWLVKGYVMRMEYDRTSGEMSVHTLSVLATLKRHDFHISEAGPPSKSTAFSSFQAKGKSFFMHTEVFQDRDLLSRLVGAYSVFEDKSMWDQTNKDQ